MFKARRYDHASRQWIEVPFETHLHEFRCRLGVLLASLEGMGPEQLRELDATLTTWKAGIWDAIVAAGQSPPTSGPSFSEERMAGKPGWKPGDPIPIPPTLMGSCIKPAPFVGRGLDRAEAIEAIGRAAAIEAIEAPKVASDYIPFVPSAVYDAYQIHGGNAFTLPTGVPDKPAPFIDMGVVRGTVMRMGVDKAEEPARASQQSMAEAIDKPAEVTPSCVASSIAAPGLLDEAGEIAPTTPEEPDSGSWRDRKPLL